MKKNSYDQFREWLMSCPVKYEQDDLIGFDDDSIVFFTSKIKNGGNEDED